jgi:hypothetical protein
MGRLTLIYAQRIVKMPDTRKIIIKNMSSMTTSFFVYQQPAAIISDGIKLEPVLTSLGTGTLEPYEQSGAQLTFEFDRGIFVAAHSNRVRDDVGRITPIAALIEGSSVDAIWPIELTSRDGSAQNANKTKLSPSPLGLSKPAYDATIPEGNFGIDVPGYTPQSGMDLFCGVAIDDPKNGIILSCYVSPAPASQVFCAPEAKYFIKSGIQLPGDIIQFSTENAALCDFTSGFNAIDVTYKADGSFETKGQ